MISELLLREMKLISSYIVRDCQTCLSCLTKGIHLGFLVHQTLPLIRMAWSINPLANSTLLWGREVFFVSVPLADMKEVCSDLQRRLRR